MPGCTSASSIINDIRKQLGEAKFTKFMALDGGVTLAFVVDTTGSMGDEIAAVRRIATDVVTHPRKEKVDYVLSPFNDPATASGHGPVSYKSSSQQSEFVKLISKLSASGGGDCEELAITGINNVFTQSVEYDSPIYVFTDAGAKDRTKANLEYLHDNANSQNTPINFFLSKSGCLSDENIKSYRSIADKTGGEVLLFTGGGQLTAMSPYVNEALIGGVTISCSCSSRDSLGRKRSTSARYPILVDDSIQTLTISVVKSNEGSTVNLIKPSGGEQVNGKTIIRKGVLYLIKSPPAGLWHLTVSKSDGRDYITVRGISDLNINFDYNFIVKLKLGKTRTQEMISRNPLKGQETNVIITVSGYHKTSSSSLKLRVVDKNLNTKRTVPLVPYGKAGGRYKCSFPPPSTDFKFILTGSTINGNKFERTARGTIGISYTLIRIHYAPSGFTLKPGSSSGTIIIFALHNFDNSERFKIEVIDKQNYIQPLVAPTIYVRKGRMGQIRLNYKAPISAKKGSTHKSVIVAEGLVSKRKVTALLDLLVA